MKGKTIFFCLLVILIFAAFFFFCAAAQAEETQKEFFFKQGKDEIVFNDHGSHTGFKIGGSGIETKVNGRDALEINYGLEFCELSEKENDLDKIQDPLQYKYEDEVAYYKRWCKSRPESFWSQSYWDKRGYGERAPKKLESDEEIKKSTPNGWICSRLKIGKIILIKAGNKYVAMKPVEFIPRYASIEEVPFNFKYAFVEKRIKRTGKTALFRTNDIRDLPNSRHEYEEVKDENGEIILQKKFEYIEVYRSMVYEWKWWPNVGPESQRAREEAGIKTLTVSPSKNSYAAGISFSWKIPSDSQSNQSERLTLNYEVKLSSIRKLELALVKGIGIADIKNPGLHSFNEVGQGSGEIPVGLNEIIIFRVNNDKCFALMPVRVEDNGIVKGIASGEVINKSIVYEQRNWSKAELALNK